MAFEIDLLPVGSEKKSGDCIAMRYGDLVNGRYLAKNFETPSSKLL